MADVNWLMAGGGWRISRAARSVVAAMPGWVDDIVQPVVHQVLARQDANDMVALVGDDQVLCSAGVDHRCPCETSRGGGMRAVADTEARGGGGVGGMRADAEA